MTCHSKLQHNTLYYAGCGVGFEFLYVKELEKYTKIVMIDILPNAKEWSTHQELDCWIDLCNDNNTLEKLIKNLTDRFGTDYKMCDNNVIKFKYDDGRLIEYHYNTDCLDYRLYDLSKDNGVLIDKINFMLYRWVEEVLEHDNPDCNIYWMNCDCGNDNCVHDDDNVLNSFGIEYSLVNPTFPDSEE